MANTFVQLTTTQCAYLLELIEDMDSETSYTEKQRSYTVPKLEKIKKDARTARLAFQDVDYLLDLIEDDDLPSATDIREETRQALLEIQALQSARYEETRNIEDQRLLRKSKRLGSTSLT